jgi:hypothetical protein
MKFGYGTFSAHPELAWCIGGASCRHRISVLVQYAGSSGLAKVMACNGSSIIFPAVVFLLSCPRRLRQFSAAMRIAMRHAM